MGFPSGLPGGETDGLLFVSGNWHMAGAHEWERMTEWMDVTKGPGLDDLSDSSGL